MMYRNGFAVSHFPAYGQCNVRTLHTRFSRCEQFSALANPAVSEEAVFFAEPRGLGGSHGAGMRVCRYCVGPPNEREQSHDKMLNIERHDKDMPSDGLFR